MALFICPGVCDFCDEKSCPQRDKLDMGFEQDLAATPLGKIVVEKYERLKSMLNPKFLVIVYFNEIQALIAKTVERKERLEEIIEEDVIRRVVEILNANLPENFKFDERDQIPKRMQACGAKVGSQIYRLVQGACNELFCGNCCILPACSRKNQDTDGNGGVSNWGMFAAGD